MRTLVLALSFLAVAVGQPTYYARGVAGLGSSGDGGPAKAARVFLPSRITSDAAGNLYVAEGFGRIRRIALDGTITSYATRQDGSASGDNGPAVSAGISTLMDLAASGDYLYLAQRVPCNIRRIQLSTGIITNFAGNGTCAPGADGAAASTSLDSPGALAVDAQGRIYVTEAAVLRRIDPGTGRIETFAGDGTAGFAGDGGAARQARFSSPLGLAIDTNSNVYVSDTGNCRIRKISAAGVVSTVAGSVNCGTAGNGELAIVAQLSGNADIALNDTGTELYIASGSTTIRRLDLVTGIIDRFAGTGVQGAIQDNVPSLTADLRAVSGVHVDRNRDVLFTDTDGNRVGRIQANGNLSTVAGALMFAGDGAPAQLGFLSQPVDVLAEGAGRLLISESINRRVRRVAAPGVLSTVAGSGAPGAASGNGASALAASLAPEALARDASGNIYVTDALSKTIRVIGVNGSINQVGPVFNSMPGGVAVDPTERFAFISIPAEHRVVRVSLSTREISVYAGLGAPGDAPTSGFSGDGGLPTAARLNSPRRLFADTDGSLYVADSGNHRIRRITANGDRIETVAGNGLSDFSGDGNLATQASIPSPIGMTLDADGNLIVSNRTAIFRVDRGTNRLRRIAGSGVIGNSSLGVPALQAVFHSINNVTVDARGVIYFADQGNLRVVELTPSTSTAPIISGVIAPGAFGAGSTLTAGGWLEIYGDRLSTVTRTWNANDFNGPIAPTTLSGVSVRIGGVSAYVQSISPGQINAVVPDGVIPGNAAIEVTRVLGPGLTVTSDPLAMVVADRAAYLLAPPALSRDSKQYVAAILPNGAFVAPAGLLPGTNSRRARTSDRLVVYGVGFGPTNPGVAAGNIASGLTKLENTQIRVGGVEASIEYAGLASGYVGLYQFNFVVPTAPGGDVKLEILVNGEPLTQTLYLPLE